jgi:hypothetical protein
MGNTTKTYKYLGAIHIHTLYSDGTGDIETITNSAKKAGLDWIIITDHDNFSVQEGIINGIYVIKGEEISPDYGNHYLAFGINKLIHHSDNCQENIDAVKSNGGFGFAAHPDESDVRNNSHKPLKWTDKNIKPDGVEIWNLFSQWGDNYNDKNIFTIAYSYLFKHNLITKPYRKTLDWWDKLNNENSKIVPAIAGSDAHELKISKYIIPVKILSYDYSFKTILNQIHLKQSLSNDFGRAKEQILNAVKNGNNTIANLSAGKDIPKIYISNNNSTVQSGEVIKLDSDTYINVECKKKTQIKVVKDGKQISTTEAKNLKLKLTDSGKYRVETEINGWGFAYSNPIMVEG